MKRSLRVFAAILALACTLLTATAKQPELSDKEKTRIEKEEFKKAKQAAKNQSKKGWEIEGPYTMQEAIGKHRAKMEIYGLKHRIGTATAGTRSLARKKAAQNAANAYANEVSAVVQGKIVNEDKDRGEREREEMMARFETRLAAEIAGELQESYSMYRRLPDGRYEIEIYYLIDPEASKSAMVRAARQEEELNEMDEKWFNDVADSID